MNPYLAAAEDALETIRQADPATYAATLAQLAIASAIGEIAEAIDGVAHQLEQQATIMAEGSK